MYRTIITSVVLLLVLTLSSCAQHKSLVQNPEFNIEKASFSTWILDDADKSSGMNIRFTVKNLPENVAFDSIFFKGQFAPVTETDRQDEYVAHFISEAKKDIILSSDISKEANNPRPRIPQKPPVPLKPNEALLVYSKNGNKQYHKLSSLENKGTKTPGEKPFN